MCLGAVVFAVVRKTRCVSSFLMECFWNSSENHQEYRNCISNAFCYFKHYKCSCQCYPTKNSENLDMIYDIHKAWVIGKDDFGSINLRQSACSDSEMFGYC